MNRFLFITCQVGAERAVKSELSRNWPDFRPAYSRPGFLTVKLPDDQFLAPDFDLKSVFARAYGFSLGKVMGDDPADMACDAWKLLAGRAIDRVHVWERDKVEAGQHGFEPSITPAAVTAYDSIRAKCPYPDRLSSGNHLDEAARPGDWIADCVLVELGEWWIGFHRVRGIPSRCPGGMMRLELPSDAVSRAWLKMEEALRWSQLPLGNGARCAEIGSAPGGSSQSLLARGCEVVGIDPAIMDPAIGEHPDFRHVRRRIVQVPRRAFRKIRWLTADMNVAPRFTLDAVEAIVIHPEVKIRGLLLTLKLLDWAMVEQIPQFFDRIRSWGFNIVRGRQLQHNRREFCIAALKKPFRRMPNS